MRVATKGPVQTSDRKPAGRDDSVPESQLTTRRQVIHWQNTPIQVDGRWRSLDCPDLHRPRNVTGGVAPHHETWPTFPAWEGAVAVGGHQPAAWSNQSKKRDCHRHHPKGWGACPEPLCQRRNGELDRGSVTILIVAPGKCDMVNSGEFLLPFFCQMF